MKMPEKFIRVEQPRGSKVCGAATCAMATGKTLEEVLSEIDWKSLSHVAGMACYLAMHGITMGFWFGNLEDGFDKENHFVVDPRGRPAVVAVTSNSFTNADHWVFWDGEKILDPSPFPVSEHEILEVHFLTYWQEPTDVF